MKRFRVRRTALVALAMVFLAVAWVWDGLVAGGRALAGFIPWARFKQSFAVLVDRLPAPSLPLARIAAKSNYDPNRRSDQGGSNQR